MQFYSSESSDEETISWFSSDTSSSSEAEEQRNKITKIQDFLTTIKKFSDVEFRSHFRLKRSVVYLLIEKYEAENSSRKRGKKQIGAEKDILLTLWYLSNTDTFREISNLFNVSKSTAHKSVCRVVRWLVQNAHLYIQWPNRSEQINIEDKFQRVAGFPHVLGCIDGSHIRIRKPTENPIDFYNRKKYYSILLQGVVTDKKKFIDIHVGEPGSIHDSRLLKKLNLFKKCSEHHDEFIQDGRVLLGDSAYPCLKWLILPFKDLGNLTESQKQFNNVHSSTRVIVENTFGLLKNRFRRLTSFNNYSINFIINCVVAACVLHNICIESDSEILEDDHNGSNHDHEVTEAEDNESSHWNVENIENRRNELLTEMFG